MILVSACLGGVNCRWNGENRLNKKIESLVKEKKAIPLCPEILGGLPTPRPPAEISGGTGIDVLDGKAKVIDREGSDITKNFILGAYEVLRIAKENKIRRAFLKSRSPSCGCGKIYDGTFKGRLKKGDGVLAALLKREGIKIKGV